MTKPEVQGALLNKDTMYWHDPDPIPGNDYKISLIKMWPESDETCLIQYSDGGSEAEVYFHEIKDYPLSS